METNEDNVTWSTNVSTEDKPISLSVHVCLNVSLIHIPIYNLLE